MLKALLIEDTREFCPLLRLIFESHYQVDCAHSLKEAKELIAYNNYEFAILDLELNDAGPNETLRYLDECLKTLFPVIVFSGYEFYKEESLKNGAADFISKRCAQENGIDVFVDKIENALLKKHLILKRNILSRAKSVFATAANDFVKILENESRQRQQSERRSP